MADCFDNSGHDWRLIEERTEETYPPSGDVFWTQPTPLPMAQHIKVTHVARWYCTHCRTIEETTQ